MAERRLPWDWFEGPVPANAILHEESYLETAYSFHHYRSERPEGLIMRRGSHAYLGTMFDVGRDGRVVLDEFALATGVWFICDDEIVIGSHTLLSWNVVIMDTYRVPKDEASRRAELREVASRSDRRLGSGEKARAIHIGSNAWLGFDVCVLPGVRIGDGAVVGARSVVYEDIEPYTIAAGNPARTIRSIER